MKRNLLPDTSYLRSVFRYDDETGILYWRERIDAPSNWNGRFAGKIAGGQLDKGIDIVLAHVGRYKAHRIIWKMVYGVDPPHEIDHADGDAGNNRISNLRPATRQENMRNVPARAASGYKGVSRHKSGKWRARIAVSGREICKYFEEPEEAYEEYCRLANKHFGEFARLV